MYFPFLGLENTVRAQPLRQVCGNVINAHGLSNFHMERLNKDKSAKDSDLDNDRELPEWQTALMAQDSSYDFYRYPNDGLAPAWDLDEEMRKQAILDYGHDAADSWDQPSQQVPPSDHRDEPCTPDA